MTERAPVTCAGCGLLCDDVAVERSGDAVRLEPRCELGAEWFAARLPATSDQAPATVGGEPVDLDTALARAAELLRGARRPLLHGFDGATVEDARAAVALADRLGALVATDAQDGAWPGAPALALRGASTATLGEIRDRPGLVVIWREDPMRTHPRLLSRLGFDGDTPAAPPGADRTLIVIDDRDTATAERAEVQLRWPPERDLEALSALHVLQRNLPLIDCDLAPELEGLLERLVAVPHAAFVHGAGLGAGMGGQRRVLALHELVRALSHDRHVVTLDLPRAAGNRGAQDVLAWQTGYAPTVDLASGHPELVSAPWPLAAGEGVDVSLCIEGAPGALPAEVTQIAFGCLPVADAEVSIRTAPAGVAVTGTMHRLDGVPLSLQAPFAGDAAAAPTAAELLGRLLAEVGL